MKFNDDVFEAAARIAASVAEEADVELSKEGADRISDFFGSLYLRLSLIAQGEDITSSAPGKFEVYRDAGDKFRFRLKAANGEIIAVSESYTRKDACLNGIKSVMKSVPGAEIKDE